MPTGQDMATRLESAIEVAELSTQYAPGGHPLYGAIDDAKALLAWLRDNVGIIPNLPSSDRVPIIVDQAVEALANAEASLRVDPSQPLPKTIWPTVTDKWPWIAAGAVALLVVGQLLGED